MQSKVPKGLATWAGIVAAIGQYAASVAVFLNDPDKAVALGPLTTATVTLITVIYGRMQQARTLAAAGAVQNAPVAAAAQPTSGEDLDPEPPARDATIANPELDDPDYVPTHAEHSGLRG